MEIFQKGWLILITWKWMEITLDRSVYCKVDTWTCKVFFDSLFLNVFSCMFYCLHSIDSVAFFWLLILMFALCQWKAPCVDRHVTSIEEMPWSCNLQCLQVTVTLFQWWQLPGCINPPTTKAHVGFLKSCLEVRVDARIQIAQLQRCNCKG